MNLRQSFRPIQISLALAAALALATVPACAQKGTALQQDTTAQEGTALDTEDAKTLYALGLALAQNISAFGLTANELATVEQGIEDVVLGNELKVELATYGAKLQSFAQARMAAASTAEEAEAAAFIEEEAAKEGAVQKDSGLILTEISAGNGASPQPTDTVKVHYHGTLRDGSVFDSSVDRGEPVTFGLNQVIPCWTEGLQAMKVGGKSRLICPPDIAYGGQGRPPKIPGGAALVFEVELLEIEDVEQ